MIDRDNLFPLRRCGFTLIEVLTASVILAIAVTTICSLSARSLSQTRRNLDLEQAWQMMDRQFTLIEQMGIKVFIERGVSKGEIEASIDEKTGQAKYYWQANVETSLTYENLYEITLTIAWDKNKSITASTMLNTD